MPDAQIDFSGVTMDIDGEALVAIILPKIIQALLNDQSLQNQLIQAVLPALRAQLATLARATAGAGTTTPRNAS